MGFVVHLHEEGLKGSTIAGYVTALNSVLGKVEDRSVLAGRWVTLVVAAAKRSRPSQPRYSSTWDVKLLVDYCRDHPNPLKLSDWLDRTVLLWAVAGCFRASDLKCMIGVTFAEDGAHMELKDTKNAPLEEGFRQQAFLGFLPPHLAFTCPVRSALRYLELSNMDERMPLSRAFFMSLVPRASNGPLFPLKAKSIGARIKRFMTCVGIDTRVFSAHSAKVVGVSAIAEAGASLEDLLIHCRNRSLLLVQRHYNRARRISVNAGALPFTSAAHRDQHSQCEPRKTVAQE